MSGQVVSVPQVDEKSELLTTQTSNGQQFL
jgi:hypothetical protein